MLAVAATIFLLSPINPTVPPPSLPSPTSAVRTQTEARFTGRTTSRELVVVGVRPDGTPAGVAVTQRLDLKAFGDYSFVIPAPATSIRPGPATESQPGLRDLGIVWQGFANKHRVLAATVTLQPAAAAQGLPLRIAVERRGGAWAVRLTNVTAKRLSAASGQASLAALQGVLARLRAAYGRSGVVAGLWQVPGAPGAQVPVTGVAPIRVTGTVGEKPVDVRLGGAAPLERVVDAPGVRRPGVRLRVELATPLEILPTAAALAHAHDPLLALQTGLASVATAWAYRHYLGSPDALSAAEAVYTYRTVRVAPAAPVATTGSGGGNTLAIVLGAVLGAAALAGLAVLWARS